MEPRPGLLPAWAFVIVTLAGVLAFVATVAGVLILN